jgi:hypothetical protein
MEQSTSATDPFDPSRTTRVSTATTTSAIDPFDRRQQHKILIPTSR